jgi:hypothetical protein
MCSGVLGGHVLECTHWAWRCRRSEQQQHADGKLRAQRTLLAYRHKKRAWGAEQCIVLGPYRDNISS